MMDAPVMLLPPGFAARESAAPWQDALAAADSEEAGTLLHATAGGVLHAALILAPDRPVSEATVLRLATLAVLEAVLAIAPPECAVTIVAADKVAVNHGEVATLTVAGGPPSAGGVAEWMVLGLTLRLALGLAEPGLTPWLTDLAEEGFYVDSAALLESICRYLLSMIDLWQTEGEVGITQAWHAAGAA